MWVKSIPRSFAPRFAPFQSLENVICSDADDGNIRNDEQTRLNRNGNGNVDEVYGKNRELLFQEGTSRDHEQEPTYEEHRHHYCSRFPKESRRKITVPL